jgi:hypothetical protein
MKKIHHVGIVSEKLDLALNMFNIKKSQIQEIINDDIQHNKLHFIQLESNDPWIEIIIPKNSDSTVFNYTKKYKMGLHHMGILCNSIKEIESQFEKNIEVVKIGNYQLTVESFGGKISTLFIANHNMITEYIEINNE